MKKIQYLQTITTAEKFVGSTALSMCIKTIGLKNVSINDLREGIIVLYHALRKKIDKLQDNNRLCTIAIRFNRATAQDITQYKSNIAQIAVLKYKTNELYNILICDEI